MILGELARVLPAVQGLGDPESGALYLRAIRARGSASERSSNYAAMAGLVLANLMQRQPAPAEDLARELLEVAVDSTSRACAEHLMGAVHYHQGNLREAIAHTERGLALAPDGLTLGPVDQRCSALAMTAAALWQIGRIDESVARATEAIEIARNRVHPFNLILSLQAAVAIHHWRGDREIVLAMARELHECIQEQGIFEAEACAHLLQAWALFDSGDRDAAQLAAECGVTALRQHGALMQAAYLLSVATEVFVGCGRTDEAAALLRDALTFVDEGEARWWEPELHRWRGALVVIERKADGFDEAEEYFARSLHIAEQQDAASLGLRTSIDLARIRIARGRRKEARRLIDQATARIVGGADTRDLRLAGKVSESQR